MFYATEASHYERCQFSYRLIPTPSYRVWAAILNNCCSESAYPYVSRFFGICFTAFQKIRSCLATKLLLAEQTDESIAGRRHHRLTIECLVLRYVVCNATSVYIGPLASCEASKTIIFLFQKFCLFFRTCLLYSTYISGTPSFSTLISMRRRDKAKKIRTVQEGEHDDGFMSSRRTRRKKNLLFWCQEGFFLFKFLKFR